jgi:hypothetical protein
MKKRLLAVATGLLVAIGIGFVSTPAYASNNLGCDPEISAGTLGGVVVCYNHGTYTSVTLQGETEPDGFLVRVHDWTNDGHSIYVEYQPWGSTAWYTLATDAYGGPATQSAVVEETDTGFGVPIRYLRVRQVGGSAISYLFRPTFGAGSGNGCGLENHVASCIYP